jgi:chromosome partitioning protein
MVGIGNHYSILNSGGAILRKIAIANQKGGTGKTATAVSLAAALGERKRKVLLVDLDPQASATAWMDVRYDGRGLMDIFTDNGNLLDIIHNTNTPGVDIVPSSSWMMGAEKILAGEVGAESMLRGNLDRLPRRWDYILIDCPPSLGILTANALAAVREILVPVQAHFMALRGLAQLIQTVEVVKKRLNPELEITGILGCQVDVRTRHAQEVISELHNRFGNLVYNVAIRENVRLTEAPSFRQSIIRYAPRSAGAEDYRALAQEVIKQEKRG